MKKIESLNQFDFNSNLISIINSKFKFLKELDKKLFSKKELINRINIIFKKEDYNLEEFIKSEIKLNSKVNLFQLRDFLIDLYINLKHKKELKILNEIDIKYYIFSNLDNFDFKNIEIKNKKKDVTLDLFHYLIEIKRNGIDLKNFEKVEFRRLDLKLDFFNFYLKYEIWKKKNNFLDYYDILIEIRGLIQKDKNLEKVKNFTKYLNLFYDFENLSNLESEIISNLILKKEIISKKEEKKNFISSNILLIDNFSYNILNNNLVNSQIINSHFLKSSNFILREELVLENSKILSSYIEEYLKNSNLLIENGLKIKSKEIGNFNIYKAKNFLDEISIFLNYYEKNLADIKGKKTLIMLKKENLNFFKNILLEKNIQFNLINSNLDSSNLKELIFLLKIIKDPYISDIEIYHILKKEGFLEEEVAYLTRKSSLKERSIYRLYKNSKELFKTDELNKKISNFFNKIEFLREIYLKNKSISNLLLLTFDEFNFLLKEVFYDFHYEFEKKRFEEFINLIFSIENKYKDKGIDFFLDYLEFYLEFNIDFRFKNLDIFGNRIFLATYDNLKEINTKFDILFAFNLEKDLFDSKSFNSYDFFNNFSKSYKEELLEKEFNFIKFLSNIKTEAHLSYHYENIHSKYQIQPLRFLNNFNSNIIPISNKSNALFKESIDFKTKKEILYNLNSAILDNDIELAKKYFEIFIDIFQKNNKNNKNNKDGLEKPSFSLKDFIEKENSITKKKESSIIEKNKFINQNYSLKELYIRKIKENRKKEDLKSLLINKDHIYSVSQLNCFKQCPKKYYYQYLLKLPTKAKPYFDFGTSVHSVLEEIIPKIKLDSKKDLIFTEAVNLLEKNWISKGYKNEIEEKEYFDKGIEILSNFITLQLDLLKTEKERKTIALEKDFLIEIEGKKIYGIIDRVDKIGEDYEILDYKTSNSMEKDYELEKNLQLYVYALASRKLFEKYPKEIGLWYLVFNKLKKVKFKLENLDNIKNEILEVITEIEKGEFIPKPSKFNCSFCDFSKICEDKFRDIFN